MISNLGKLKTIWDNPKRKGEQTKLERREYHLSKNLKVEYNFIDDEQSKCQRIHFLFQFTFAFFFLCYRWFSN